jgi:hypothetical protein
MALIDCAECGSQVSEYAAFCPKCGLPNPAASVISEPAVEERQDISHLKPSVTLPQSPPEAAQEDGLPRADDSNSPSRGVFFGCAAALGLFLIWMVTGAVGLLMARGYIAEEAVDEVKPFFTIILWITFIWLLFRVFGHPRMGRPYRAPVAAVTISFAVLIGIAASLDPTALRGGRLYSLAQIKEATADFRLMFAGATVGDPTTLNLDVPLSSPIAIRYRELVRQAADLERTLEKDLGDLTLEGIFAPEQVGSKAGRKEMRRQIGVWKSALERYERGVASLFPKFRAFAEDMGNRTGTYLPEMELEALLAKCDEMTAAALKVIDYADQVNVEYDEARKMLMYETDEQIKKYNALEAELETRRKDMMLAFTKMTNDRHSRMEQLLGPDLLKPPSVEP